ncbi:hypothetical protein [Paenimyroides aestuarii]|uniref:Histidine kinase n=1 Tax=Paenimyroides aestuarii TaxID=2968490 RepID=A0ABY5NQP6_9FLAO|nr:hypothetical protein [Paenimyroides aestuarii]UUV20822.1 hypothetical protein NPX36_10905 [Paenimyroides aestuarii]
MHQFIKVFIFVGMLAMLSNCREKKVHYTGNYKIDSITMRKKYNKEYAAHPNNLKKLHSLYKQEGDSILLGINHQLYSDYLVKNTKYDSAYYYLTLAHNLFKNNNEKRFFNSIRKVAITNRLELLTQSRIELEKAETLRLKDKQLQKLYVDVFSLPLLQQHDSLDYNQKMQFYIENKASFDEILDKNPFLENYLTSETSKFLMRKAQHDDVVMRTGQRIEQLLKEKRTSEDVFFTNLFYTIFAKINNPDARIQKDFDLYKAHLASIPTKETEALYYYLKAKYFQKLETKDSVYSNYLKALEISRETNNFMYEHHILEQLIVTDKALSKKYMADYIKMNDSLLSYKNYIDDFIFSNNSNTFSLKSEQQNIQKRNLNIIAFTFLVLFSMVLYYFIYRNVNMKQLARKHRDYLDEKTKMYKYLIDIKEQMDASILKENNNTKQLIYTKAISKIDDLMIYFNDPQPDLTLLQNKIKEIEDESRRISHIISATEYHIVDLNYIINDIKNHYSDFIKIETFIDHKIILNDVEFKTLLRITLFTRKFIDRVKFKENLTCFLSIYKKNHKTIYKIWLSKPIVLNKEQISFLKDRTIYFESTTSETESTLLLYIA